MEVMLIIQVKIFQEPVAFVYCNILEFCYFLSIVHLAASWFMKVKTTTYGTVFRTLLLYGCLFLVAPHPAGGVGEVSVFWLTVLD